MLTKTTHTFATHEIPLECDVYTGEDYSPSSPAFLFFHSGGLVGGDRGCVPPWLAQVCYKRKWPLISASYRLLPQAKASGLLEDVTAAYEFARRWETPTKGQERRVIVGGGSAGFFMATLVAHHLQPPPLALLSITGIATFRHPFFNTSVLLTPVPIKDSEMAHHISAPVSTGTREASDPAFFYTNKVLSTGEKNPDYSPPAASAPEEVPDEAWPRGCLYDYWLYGNQFVQILGDVDPGYEWAKAEPHGAKANTWPTTIIIHGDADDDVDFNVSSHMVECIGEDKVKLFSAKGQGHLFEATYFLEDDAAGMGSVREAVAYLDKVVAGSS